MAEKKHYDYEANTTLCDVVQEAEGGPSAADLQEKLTLTSADEPPQTLNGRLVANRGPVTNGNVFDDF